MSQFHKPRLSSAIVCALFCVNYSFASPLVIAASRHPRASIIAASEPVHIIPSEDLPADWIPPKEGPGTSTITDDGTTLLTTYNNPRDLARKREEGTASEPVNIIPIDRLPPDLRGGGGGGISSVTDDGTTQTTTYNVGRALNRKRANNSPVVSASEPVNIIPADRFPELQGGGGGISNVVNDGTTVTTTFNNSAARKTLSQTDGLNLVTPANTTAVAASGTNELTMGLNCQGSGIMCIGAAQSGVMHTLRDYMYAIPHGYRYYAGQDIACMKHHVYPNPWISWGYYCAFMQGNISSEGLDGAEIQLKMQQMIEHHCMGCGSVPISPDNDPQKLGILTVNYVRQSECEGLCYYVPPGQSAASVKVPQGMVLVQ